MSAESEKIRQTLGEQLSDLDDSLGATSGDVAMLADIQRGIGRLLSDNDSFEGEIRHVLQERFDKGDLRKETYQLVKSMLDRYVSENVSTSPTSDKDEPIELHETRKPELGALVEKEPDEYSSTDVIPNEALRPPTADDRVQVGSVLRDRFLLQERITGGSMGVVYKALDRRLAEAGSKKPWVAIKVLSPQLSQSAPALRALQQEAAKGRCLTHPGIVRFLDLDRDDDLYFIIMEWLEGRTLADILDSPDGKNISEERALEIVRQVGKALEYAHKCGIVHADVKPGNVMILPNGGARLFDFGIARVVQAQARISQFDPGVLDAITPEYSSMQVLTGDEPAPSDDVFSLACLMYRLIAGYRVFGPRNAAEAAEEGMKPQVLKTLPEPQWRALKKALSFARVTRFETMNEFLEALDNRSVDTISLDSDEQIEQDSGGSKLWLLGLIAILGLLGAAGYQFGIVDIAKDWLDQDQALPGPATSRPVIPDIVEERVEDSAEIVEPAQTNATNTADSVEPLPESIPEPVLEAEPIVPLVDFSRLPPADFEIALSAFSGPATQLKLSLREDAAAVVIDLVRDVDIDLPLDVRIEEISYSGNRSPWASGQLVISDDGLLSLPAGQDRARITLQMASDPLREADQQSTLLIREADSVNAELALIELVLEDDDQRAFEARLPSNTVAFAVSQIAVAERDPAAQIDILRFNPDSQAIVVGYVVRDITAVEGEDYFSPGGHSISFEPGQRTARLLIPLVQDSVLEGDEAFTVELVGGGGDAAADVFQRLVIMIRDDDAPIQ
jgi:serine/threonine protein kinase